MHKEHLIKGMIFISNTFAQYAGKKWTHSVIEYQFEFSNR